MGSKDKKKSKENKQKKQEINKDKSKKKEEKENKQKKQETNKDKSNKKEKKEKQQKKLEKKEKNKNEKKIKKEIEKELHEILEKDDKKAEILGLTNDMMDPMTLSKAFLRISTKEDGKGATQESIERILKAYDLLLSYRTKYHFGYPYNLSFEHEELFPFLRFSINNLGDPFVESNYGVHSRMFELEVLDYYASIWKIDKKAYWGYVTCSGTEGNLHGLYVGRECLNNPILYASIESHYSVFKAARFYKIDVRPIPTQRNGQIDYEKFETELKNNLERDVLFNANIGTYVKGAIDDVDKLIEIIEKNNFTEKNTFIHCDGALFGLMVPFLSGKFPEINFTKKMIKSVSVSGHKFLGCPMPCGVVIHRKDNIKRIETPIPYLNSVDTTIMGSRNGQASLFMWLSLKKKGTEGIKKDVERCCEYSREFAKLLDKHNISHMLNEESNTIVMVKPPSDNFVKKWQLACVDTIAHAIVMPSTTLEKISVFVEEMVSVMESLDWPDICVESHIGDHCRCKKCKN